MRIYWKFLSDWSYRGVMGRISNHFIAHLYMMIIFEQYLSCMSQAIMEVMLDITNWYASPDGTFISMYIMDKASHAFLRFSIDKLIMEEVAYHISIGLLARLDRNKKASWPILPMWIGLYVIGSLKEADAKVEDFNKFKFDTKSLNLYGPHGFYRDHSVRVYYSWIHGACHYQ